MFVFDFSQQQRAKGVGMAFKLKNIAGGGPLHGIARTENPTRKKSFIAVLMAVTLVIAAGVASKAAYADPAEFFASLTGDSAQSRAFSDHTVNTVTPHGTTINLFDYWVYDRGSDDFGNYNDTNINNPDSGINAGHAFDFSTGSYDSYNAWHRMPTTGIVENELGADGYPVLAASSGIDAANLESLAYLFNSNDETTAEKISGKRAFSNVGGLLQVDSNGYYYYDSTENFASFDEGTNTFSVYDTAAVRTNESDLSSDGQFFPFNTAADVFNESNGQLVKKDPAIRAKSTDLNHWFGASMTTRFVQPTGGLTAKNEDVTYHFSGDDDVWVYIDGVLVGDLGGVHSKADLDINFRTGVVEVTGVDGELYKTTLKDLYDKAGMSTEGWVGDTFPNESLHTLKFFYLERGSADSNMSLRFNLVTVPESTIVKVDQEGNPIAGATFELYAADDNYNTTGGVLAEGTTDSNGRITLVDSTDTLITFEDLYNHNNQCTHYVLKEVSAPVGYRLSGDIHIEYSHQSGVVYSTNYWETGAYANASESITSPSVMQTQNGGQITINGKDLQYNGQTGGTLFAVVLHRGDGTGGITDASNWHGVYGSALEEGGWKLTNSNTSGFAGVIEAVQNGGAHEFTINSNGLFQADISELPGNIQKYYWVTGDEAETEYVVSFYYTTANDLSGATTGNTLLVNNLREDDPGYDEYGFHRQFAATFNVPDMYNRLLVQKVDENGTPVVGAEFTLYSENPTDNPNANALGVVTTRNLSKLSGDALDLEGAEYFEGQDGLVANSGGTGKTYWVKETKAPAGYQINDEVIEVYVDGTGVYANAGEANDGVTVLRGTGTLAKTMAQFAINDDIDTTLHDIKLTLQTGNPTADNPGWTDVSGAEEVHLSYGSEHGALEYGPAEEGGARSVQSDTGWPLARITQCLEHGDSTYKTDLQKYFNETDGSIVNVDYNLRSLFSGTATVRVANQQVNDLEISKTVTGYEGMDATKLSELQGNQEFKFTLNLNVSQNVGDSNATYKLVVTDVATEASVGDPIEVKTGEGTYTFALKHGQKATIEDLPVGTTYTVTENDLPSGFTSTPDKGSDVDAVVDAGQRTISGNLADADNNADNNTMALMPVAVSYTNAYAVGATTVSNLGVAKTITNADEASPYTWSESDSYEFWLVSYEGSPLPAASSDVTLGTTPGNLPYAAVKITSQDNPKEKGFGEITFTKPGTYKYLIREETGSIAGIDYSRADYEVRIEVVDNGNGTMTATTKVKKSHDDNGDPLNGDFEESSALFGFVNTYAVETAQWGPEGSKSYTDLTGSKPLVDGMFTFKVELSEGAPVFSGLQKSSEGDYYTVQNDLSFIEMGRATFDDAHQGKYTYTVTEVIPADATNNGDGTYTKDGMTYDSSVWTIEATAGVTDGILGVTAVYKKDGVVVADPLSQRVVFSNSYDAGDLVLSGDTAIKGTKTLEGRDSKEGETFTFELSAPAGSSTATALQNDSIVLNGDPTVSTLTQTISDGLENGVAKGFSFDNITFKKVGTYVFDIKETGFGADGNGMTWDRHTATATVKVKDNNGVLELDGPVVYSDAADASAAAFVNRYAATGSVTVKGTKAIDGRAFKSADDFSFAVTSAATNPKLSGLNDQGILAPSYVEGSSSQSLNFGTITFTQPGSYTYTFSEVIPDGGVKNGVTYDTTVRTLKIKVKDNLNGTLSVETATLDGAALTDADLNNEIFDIAGIAWTNTYAASGEFAGADNLKVTKALEGRDWKDGDSFTFKIEPYSAGNTADTVAAVANGDVVMPGQTELTIAYSDVAAGSATKAFANIAFNKTTVTGYPYAFKITEAQGGNGQGGMTYDPHERIVYVTVTDNGDGTLKTEMLRAPSGSDTWTNTYGATGSLDIAGKKVIADPDGNEQNDIKLAGYEFKIELTNGDASGITLPADNVTSDENGNFVFSGITLNKAGEYELTVSEVAPQNDADKVPGVEYDAGSKTVKITVTDDGNGGFVVNGGTAVETLQFTNTYKKPEQKKDVAFVDNPTTSIDGKLVGVGDTLIYTINWVNDAVDASGSATAAEITVTDIVPTGTELIADSIVDNGGSYNPGSHRITWSLGEQPANATGSVSFQVKVSEDALTRIENVAAIEVGDRVPVSDTNIVVNPVPHKSVDTTDEVKVGQELTYTIEFVNDQGDGATATVVDTLSSGLVYNKDAKVSINYGEATDISAAENGQELTWNISNLAAGANVKITFGATVTEDARDAITNKATVNNKSTNTVTNNIADPSSLTISKEVVNGDANKSFDFMVGFKDSAGNALAGTYKIGDANVTLSAGTDVWAGYGIATFQLKHGQSTTIEGLPAGATYKVIETKASGYTTTINGGTEVDLVDEGTISVDSPATVAYTNTYATTPGGAQADTDALFTKSISGRDWKEGDEFTFTLTPNEGAPLRDEQGAVQQNRTATASYENVKDGKVTFGFGKLYYTLEDLAGADYDSTTGQRTKTFTYNVTENDTDIAGIAKDPDTATITVTLTDDGAGNLTAAAAVVTAANADFVNTYSTGVDYDAMGGMQISKVLTSRDMTEGQFEWTVVPAGDTAAETAQKFGISETGTVVKSSAATNGTPVIMPVTLGSNVTFTNEDANKVYAFQVSETKKGGTGYTNDESVYTIKVAPTFDAATGVLTVTTTVENAAGEVIETKVATSDKTQAGGKVTVPFNNSYDAGSVTLGGEGNVKINATKTLTNRPMIDDEFSFIVTNTANTDPDAEPATTGKSKADGSIVFEKIEYTTASLEADLKNGLATRTINADTGAYAYTYQYRVSESEVTADGVAAVTQPQTIAVTVTDAHDGTPLSVGVTYPGGSDGIAFKNTYGVDAQAEVDIAGIKVLGYSPQELAADAKLTQAGIAGKYTFKISGVDENNNAAPMPKNDDGEVVSETTNDAAGNVVFGKISFTMESVFGDTGDAQTRGTERTKVFTYTVTETGELPGVANDDAAETGKTFTVTVTDDGNGGLSAETSAVVPAPLFQFTNTYSITTPELSSVTDQITITKELDGREMVGGEFNFELVENGKVVAKGSNNVEGEVTFEGITYNAPGEHDYLVREVDNGRGGVTYDTKTYSIHTSVTDNSDGTLSVKHELKDAQEALFTNTYEADPATVNLGAAKLLNNAKPGDARFTFQVLDKDGNVVAEAQNNEEGAVKFPALTFDAAGEYDYTIIEVNDGQKGVTYDESKTAVKVVVSATDADGNYTGQLYPSVEYADGTPLFSNAYTEPEDPSEPGGGKPGGSEPPALPDTSDNLGPLVIGLGTLAVIACAGLVIGAVKMRRKSGSHRAK